MTTSEMEDLDPVCFEEKIRRFYRGTLFQAIVLGLISFTQPGIWDALNKLGASGQAEPYVVNTANAVTFAIMVICAPLAGIIGNIIGMKRVLIFGTLGYSPYSLALYCNSVYGTQWFLLFGAATCGLSASALWTAEASIAVGYPEPAKRGFYIAIWLTISKLGSIIAGFIELSLNVSESEKGSISPNTYLILLALQCLGLPLSFLVSPPEKLISSDGTKPSISVVKDRQVRWKPELLALGSLFERKEILLLLPVFVSSQWGQTYNGNFLTAYFTVRARALLAFIAAVLAMLINLSTGWILDFKGTRRSLKARGTWVLITFLFTIMWTWSLRLQRRFDLSLTGIELDWDAPGFWTSAVGYLLFRIVYEITLVWVYWILGTYDSHTDTLALTMGILRSSESLGSSLSFAIGSRKDISLMNNLVVAAVAFWVSVPSSTRASWLVRDVEMDKDEVVEGEEVRVGDGGERQLLLPK